VAEGTQPEPEPDSGLTAELQRAEARLTDQRQRTTDALERATKRLQDTEARASDAESRAARAERLARLRTEETEHERRLQDMLARIAQAEKRAAEAEQRARVAVDRIAELVEPDDAQPSSEDVPPEPEPGEEQPLAAREEQPLAAREEPQPTAGEEPPPAAEDALNLNQATYDDLRGLKLSVTQTGRVLDYRETLGGFKSLDQLDDIAGLPRDLLTELKSKLTI
jgi:DNA uptake protein ComE-like DNA-binding protein